MMRLSFLLNVLYRSLDSLSISPAPFSRGDESLFVRTWNTDKVVLQGHCSQSCPRILRLQHKSRHLLPVNTTTVQANRIALHLDFTLRVVAIDYGHPFTFCFLLLLLIPDLHPPLAIVELARRNVTDFTVQLNHPLLCALECLL